MNEPIPDPVISDPELLCPQDDAPVEETAYAPQPKKGRLWPPILILSLLLTFGLLLFFFIPDAADAAMPWFTVQDGTLYFDQSKYTGGAEITIPASIQGQEITAISENCFAGCDRFIMFHLPESIRSIGSGAFTGCTALRGIKLPETLTAIGDNAFSGCTALEAVYIPYSVIQIGSSAFAGCGKLSHVFYTGPMSAWETLHVEIPSAKAGIYCSDGLYPQE